MRENKERERKKEEIFELGITSHCNAGCSGCERDPENAELIHGEIQGEGDEGAFEWIEFNQKYSEQWPNITVKKDALPDAERYAKEEGKMKYFKEGETND